jgi:hypothetical protein
LEKKEKEKEKERETSMSCCFFLVVSLAKRNHGIEGRSEAVLAYFIQTSSSHASQHQEFRLTLCSNQIKKEKVSNPLSRSHTSQDVNVNRSPAGPPVGGKGVVFSSPSSY